MLLQKRLHLPPVLEPRFGHFFGCAIAFRRRGNWPVSPALSQKSRMTWRQFVSTKGGRRKAEGGRRKAEGGRRKAFDHLRDRDLDGRMFIRCIRPAPSKVIQTVPWEHGENNLPDFP